MELSMKTKLSLFLCLLLMLISVHNSHAQTKTIPDELTDTTLAKSNIAENDTILKYRQSREFAYMNYLDSLLRKQKGIRSDTVSFDPATGRIVRHHSASGEMPAFSILNSLPLKIFFWTLAIIFIVFISYKVLFKNGLFLTGKNKLIAGNEETLSEDLNELSKYDELIANAEDNNNFNLATRYLFLKTLKTLADKELISFTAEKTNKEYVKEMEQHHYSDEFKKLTRDYEYAWYGKVYLDKNNYERMKESFLLFHQKV